MSFAAALENEERGAWPTWKDRWSFWGRRDVPEQLRNAAEPDPRPLLAQPHLAIEIRMEREEFAADRLAWLRGVAT